MAEFALSQSLWLQCAFHVQQCIEKTLKGFIVKHGDEDPPYTHDLVRLLEIAQKNLPELASYQKKLSSLNPYYIRARYPSYKEKIAVTLNVDQLKSFIQTAKEISSWCEKKTKS